MLIRCDFSGTNLEDTCYWYTGCIMFSESLGKAVDVFDTVDDSFLVRVYDDQGHYDEFYVDKYDLSYTRPDLGWTVLDNSGRCYYLAYNITNSYKKGLYTSDIYCYRILSNLSRHDVSMTIRRRLLSRIVENINPCTFSFDTAPEESARISNDFAVIATDGIEDGGKTYPYVLFYRLSPIGLVDFDEKKFILDRDFEYCTPKLLEDLPNAPITWSAFAA